MFAFIGCVVLSAASQNSIDGISTAADTVSRRELEEVVVTGSNQAVSRNLLPFTVSTVSQAQIESSGQTQLLSILSGQVPSLFVSQRGMLGFGLSHGGSGHIKIRGVGGEPTNAVLMMIDGQPQYSGVYSHHVADYYDTEYVDHVEIMRGPGSVLYGSNAMGGVINVITRKASVPGVKTMVSAQYGSYNTLQTSATNMGRIGRWSWLASASYDRSDGTQKNFDFTQEGVFAKLSYDLSGHWTATAAYSFMNSLGSDPIYPKLEDPASTDIYSQHIIRGEGSVAFANRYDSTDGSVRVYYSYGNHLVDDPRHFQSVDDRFGVLAYQNFNLWRGAAATGGFDFDTYTGRIPVSGGSYHKPGAMATIGLKRITEYSPYATLSQSLVGRRLILNAGLRLAVSDKFGCNLIPQGGIVGHPFDGFTVKGSVAKGYRNPSFKELYLYRMANPRLDPETMVNYEVAMGWNRHDWLTANLTVYYSHGDNLIQTVDMKNVNTGKFINKGVEVSLSSRVSSALNLTASYSYLHTSLAALAGAPRHQYFIGARWHAFKGFHVDAQLKGVGSLFVSERLPLESYATLDLRAAYRLCRFVELSVKFDNITAARYQIMRGYEMPGFTAMGGVKCTF